MSGWRDVVAVAVGGVIGTGLRLILDTVLTHADAGFPISTLLVNVVGSFVLGALVATLWRKQSVPNWFKLGLGTGVIGSFTTFSALVVSLIVEAHRGLWMLALVYLAASLLLGFGAALLGLSLGRRPRLSPTEIQGTDR